MIQTKKDKTVLPYALLFPYYYATIFQNVWKYRYITIRKIKK